MGERKGQNKYYPPDFDPAKHFNLDKYHGTHPLRERARKLQQGILVIRFEMPYNIWCDGCNNPIGMGVRYNAEKSKMGNYYTTPIYKFRMKCHLCDTHFEIKTDPQNHDYVIMSGARRKEQRWDPAENEQIVTEDKNDIKKRAIDAMFKLEHGVDDKGKIKASKPAINKLQNIQQRSRDDYLLNKLARHKFRTEKKSLKVSADQDQELLEKSSLAIPLAVEHEQDVRLASLLKYSSTQSYEEKQKEKQKDIDSHPIFSSSTSSKKNITDLKQKLNLSINTKLPNPFGSPSTKHVKDTLNFGIVKRKSRNDDDHKDQTKKDFDSGKCTSTIGENHLEEREGDKELCNTSEKSSESKTGDGGVCLKNISKTPNGGVDVRTNSPALGSLVCGYGESDSDSTG